MPTDEPGQAPPGEGSDQRTVSLVAQTVVPAEDAEQEEEVAALPYWCRSAWVESLVPAQWEGH